MGDTKTVREALQEIDARLVDSRQFLLLQDLCADVMHRNNQVLRRLLLSGYYA